MRALLITAAAFACFAAVVVASADEPKRMIDVSRALDAGSVARGLPDIAITRTPPDPPPLVEKSQWVYDLRWDRGELWLLGVHPLELAAPQATPRVMGRFAVELFEGPTLLERVRFDFPLLGADDPEGGPSMSSKLRTRIGVVFPATKRGTRLELWDRATNRRWSLPWPPQGEAAAAPSGSAGARPDAGAD
ncbi:MAG TPA: hypothetical protein VGG39_08345 [Polyangiaceae bacterium]